LLPCPYRIPYYTAEIKCVLTNKTPTGTYRGPGRFEGTFVRERLMDIAAQRLGVDPLELRRKNFIRPDEMPYEVGGASLNQRIVYDCGDYASALDKALAALGYAAARREQDDARRQGRHVGIGVASALLEAAVEDLVLGDGAVHVRGVPDRTVSFRELARAAVPGPPDMEPGLYAAHFFEAPAMTYPYGCHAAIVEVDVETARVKILKYALAYDIGKAVNPMIVEGQLVGAMAQGIGGALLEELVYDEQGQLLTTTFMDYLVPTVMEMPEATAVRILEETPTPLNPLGVKGAGEGGSSGCGAALANAVADALAPLGVP